jgi:hypothetical protein
MHVVTKYYLAQVCILVCMAKLIPGDSPAAALARMRAEALSPERRSEIASQGGKAGAAKMTDAQRKARSQKALEARWGKKAKKVRVKK